MAKLNFHVRHEVKPDRVWGVLEAVAEGFEYDHITQGDRQLSRLRQLGLVADSGEPEPTELGQQVYELGMAKTDVLNDILHYLHYTRWDHESPLDNTMFYTYRAYCDLLYRQRTAEIRKDTRETFTAELNGQISNAPEFVDQTDEFQKGAVSLSANSLRGVEHWLTELSPSVLQDDQFERRHFCVAELFVLAIGYVTEQTQAELGIEQLLTPEKREMICRLCLLDESDFDQTLDWMLPAYPNILQPGTNAGNYGRFIRVVRLPEIGDVIE